MNTELQRYQYNGARSLVLLHEQYLRSFVETWKQAKAKNVVLPKTDDPAYVSPEALLRHILRASRGYMTWICDKLELLDPQINSTPADENIETEADNYLEHAVMHPLRHEFQLKNLMSAVK